MNKKESNEERPEPTQDELTNPNTSIESRYRLVNSLLAKGENSQARQILIDITAEAPDNHQILNNLGVLYLLDEELVQALDSFERANKLDPENPTYHINLGKTHQALGNWEKAISSFQHALNIDNDLALAHNGLGLCYRAQENYECAISSFQAAANSPKPYAQSEFNLGSAYLAIGRHQLAIEQFEQYAKTSGASVEVFLSILNAYRRLNEYGKYEVILRQAFQVFGRDPRLCSALGLFYKDKGESEKAANCFQQALEQNIHDPETLLNFSLVHKFSSNDDWLKKLESEYTNVKADTSAKMLLGFALAHAYLQLGRDFLGINLFFISNALRKGQLGYSIEKDVRLFQRLKEFNQLSAVDPDKASVIHSTPVFIVGMPRSGTTLVEQLLGNHPNIQPQGELDFLTLAVEESRVLESPTIDKVRAVRDIYLSLVGQLDISSPYYTDKMPLNFRWIGIITAAIPEARIIYIHRSENAVCFSLFRQYFASSGNGYSYSLQDTKTYYGLHAELMQHLRNTHGKAFASVSYEDVVENPRLEMQKLLEYIGVGWDEACAETSNKNRIARTASSNQVNQPIYKGSSDTWQRYSAFLKELSD